MAPAKNKKFYKKYLRALQNAQGFPKDAKHLLEVAPIPVLKLISNLAIAAASGPLKQKARDLTKFKSKRKLFGVLGDRKLPFEQKRKYLLQNGGASFIPILLASVAPLIGDLLFKAFSKQ